jgi:DNA-directed RNA polymerase subunit RPC12/RpoP
MSNPEQVKCPNCGANLNVVPDASYFFCRYCGTKIETNLAKREIVHRTIDETKIETTRMQTELELAKFQREREKEARKEERERRDAKIVKWFWIIVGIFALLSMLSSRR